MALASCSDNATPTEKMINNKFAKSIKSTSTLSECPEGYMPSTTIKVKLHLFHKSEPSCTTGFGMCFMSESTVTTTCISIRKSISEISPTATYDESTDDVDVTFIFDEVNGTVRLYFPDAIVNSPNHNSWDFDQMDIDNDILINDTYLLQQGSYTKSYDGDFWVYEIPLQRF